MWFNFVQTCADTTDGNILVSPYSLGVTLTLLYQGASDQTLYELKSGLNLPDQQEAAVQFQQYSNAIKTGAGASRFEVANNIYLRNGDSLNPGFRDVAENIYSSHVQQVDFAEKDDTARKINKDVEKKTNGKITNLIQPDQFTADSRLFFVNAVYFKGAWQLPFQQNLTQLADFKNADRTTSSVPFMHAEKDYYYSFFRDLNASMLELKYHNSNFSLLILLPNLHTNIHDLERNMGNKSIADMVSRLVFDEVEVDIPRFNVQYEIKAKDVFHRVAYFAYMSHQLNAIEIIN